MNEKEHFGGAGLKGSAPSYLRFIQAILRGGELDGARILKQETVDLMFEEHLTTDQQRADFGVFGTNDQEPFTRKAGKPLSDMTFGLGGGLSGKGVASGRGARTLTWSGMAVRPPLPLSLLPLTFELALTALVARRTPTGGSTGSEACAPSSGPTSCRSGPSRSTTCGRCSRRSCTRACRRRLCND